jgi:hypothetical protein
MIMYIAPEDINQPFPLSPSGFAALISTVNHTSYNPSIRLNNPGGSAPNDIVSSMSMILLK